MSGRSRPGFRYTGFSETRIPRSHRLSPSGAHPSNISHLLLGVCIHTNLEDYYELGWGKGRRGVTMPPLRAYANKNSPEGLRVEERVRRRGGGKETLQEIRRRPHVGPSSRSVRGQVPVGTGTNYPWTGRCSECMIPYQKATTGGKTPRGPRKGMVGNERNGLSEGER
jgi:hypothetical protein